MKSCSQNTEMWKTCPYYPACPNQVWPLKLEALPSTSPRGGSGNVTWPKPAHIRPGVPTEGPYSSLITGRMRTGLIYTLLVGACIKVRPTAAEPWGATHKQTRWAQTHPAIFPFILKGGIQHLTKRKRGGNTGTFASAKPCDCCTHHATDCHHEPFWDDVALHLPTLARDSILNMQTSSFNTSTSNSIRLNRRNIRTYSMKAKIWANYQAAISMDGKDVGRWMLFQHCGTPPPHVGTTLHFPPSPQRRTRWCCTQNNHWTQ